MRKPNELVHSRARVRRRFALLPLEGYPTSRIASWEGSEVRVLASPALGTHFVEYLMNVPAGREGSFAADQRVETFYYVLAGEGRVGERDVRGGSFGLLAPSDEFSLQAQSDLRVIVFRKVFEPAKNIEMFKNFHGHESQVKAEPFAENSHTRLQLLIPDDLQFDMGVNIFTFEPGHGLPYVETHVMEHGLYFLEGKGMYYLDDEWLETQAHDFIWMAAYCPQSFYATGPTPTKYLYYKNVNREIAL